MTTFEAKKELKRALSALSHDHSMGYLALTSKPELPVRDRVAWHFHKKHPRLVVAREYTVNSKKKRNLRKKVDLALLDSSHKPVVLVEFKAMIGPDPLRNREHKNMTSLVDDLKSLGAICPVPRMGVMLMVDVKNCEQLNQRGIFDRVVKYMPYFCNYEKEPNRIQKTIEVASKFFHKFGLKVTPLTVRLGSVWGASVKLICFILEPGS